MNEDVSASSTRILLAEDDPSNRRVTQLMLRRLGYEADTVANGLEVLQALEKQPYDIVLMDILMPKMDGLVAAEEIRRRWPELCQPKIIAIQLIYFPIKNAKIYSRVWMAICLSQLNWKISGRLSKPTSGS